ncbi:5-formyltetrahydrofolate cyclo-ligase [Bacillus sp. 1P06AnD]|uniref:5-formyltetrahydrofolate cyclo-ligase n=1 Tax=Bacillus sp. 1P06AnD TaxID=3132208 RepID=UPI0039A1AF33
MTKQSIRLEVKKYLETLGSDDLLAQSKLIVKQLMMMEVWKQSSTIALTISTKTEIDTTELIKAAWEQGKRVAVPKCNPLSHSMAFRYLTDFNQLESVYSGLLEPIVEKTIEADRNELDFMLVPGLAFSEAGYRIGYGGGYYDRYLAGFQGVTVSLLTEGQLYHELPIDEYDMPVQWLVLPKGVINTNAVL